MDLQKINSNTVYHGTTTKHLLSLKRIDLNKCSKYADFGRGFYTTSNYSQALSFAEMRAKDHNLEELNQKTLFPDYEMNLVRPLIMVYNLNIKKLSGLNKYFFDCPDKKWAEFIYNNRVGLNKVISNFHNWNRQFGFVFGHVADAAIAPLILDVKSGIINFEEFYRKIQPYDRKNGNQLSFHTEAALECLSLKNAQIGGIIDDKVNKGLC